MMKRSIFWNRYCTQHHLKSLQATALNMTRSYGLLYHCYWYWLGELDFLCCFTCPLGDMCFKRICLLADYMLLVLKWFIRYVRIVLHNCNVVIWNMSFDTRSDLYSFFPLIKVSRPSFIPFWGTVTIERRVPLSLVIDIIIEQGTDAGIPEIFLAPYFSMFSLK